MLDQALRFLDDGRGDRRLVMQSAQPSSEIGDRREAVGEAAPGFDQPDRADRGRHVVAERARQGAFRTGPRVCPPVVQHEQTEGLVPVDEWYEADGPDAHRPVDLAERWDRRAHGVSEDAHTSRPDRVHPRRPRIRGQRRHGIEDDGRQSALRREGQRAVGSRGVQPEARRSTPNSAKASSMMSSKSPASSRRPLTFAAMSAPPRAWVRGDRCSGPD